MINEQQQEHLQSHRQGTKIVDRLGLLVWGSFMFFSSMALFVYQMGFRGSFWIGMTENWFTIPSIVMVPIYVFFILAPVFFLLLGYYLVISARNMLEGRIEHLTMVGGISSFLTGIIWIVFFYMIHTAVGPTELYQGELVWGFAIVLYGETFTLIGVTYILRNDDTPFLSNLTGVSFVLSGLVIFGVGLIDGFAFFPFVTAENYAWVSGLAVVPSILTVIQLLGLDPIKREW